MLKTLYGSIHSDKAIKELEDMGIAVYKIGEDGSKQFRKAQDVLLDLAVTAQTTNKSLEDVYKASAGGRLQWSKAAATLGDYKEFIKTWGEAVDSVGFTDKQVAMQLDTIGRRIQTLKADIMSLNVSAGQNGLATVIKDTITALDNFIAGLKQIPGWTIEVSAGLFVVIKAYGLLKDAIIAATVASDASTGTALGAALKALSLVILGVTEALGSMENAQREADRAAADGIAIQEQRQTMLEKQADFVDALLSAHQKLQVQLNSSAQGSAEYNKILSDQQETEKQLSNVLGEAAVKRLQDANWSAEASQQESDAFKQGVVEKKKALQSMIDARITALNTEKEIIEDNIRNYWKDTESFGQSLQEKAKYLKWYQELEAKYNNWMYESKVENAKASEKKISEYQDELAGMSDFNSPEYQQTVQLLDTWQSYHEKQLAEAQGYKNSNDEIFQQAIQDQQSKLDSINKETISLKEQSMSLAAPPEVSKVAPDTTGNTRVGRQLPSDATATIEKKIDDYNAKAIADQASAEQSRYKTTLDNITDATNRYGQSYAFLDATTEAMNNHTKDLQNTISSMTAELDNSLQKANDLASDTGATISVTGGGTQTEQLINQMADKYGVDRNLAQAIAQVESGKDQSARSDAGAIGVMQLMPGTAEGLGVDPNDLAGNIEGGVIYIKQMLDDFGGDLQKAIAAYNAGPQAVKDYGGIPPYAETQAYVRKVMSEYLNPTGTSAGVTQQVSVQVPQSVLDSAGVSKETWDEMSPQSKSDFISQHKEDIKNSDILIGYLKNAIDQQKEIAKYEAELAKQKLEIYKAIIKGIQDVEAYQTKLSDLQKRTELAALGITATDSDKAIANQQDLVRKLAISNEALNQFKNRGVDIFTNPTANEERVKNLELQAQVDQQKTFATPEAEYKTRMDELEYQSKLFQTQLKGDQTSPFNVRSKYLDDLQLANERVEALQKLLRDMEGSNPLATQTEEWKKYNLQLAEAQKKAHELSRTYHDEMIKGIYDVTDQLLLQGNKISDIWRNLWKQLASDALKALMGIQNQSPGFLAKALGIFSQSSSRSSGLTDTDYQVGMDALNGISTADALTRGITSAITSKFSSGSSGTNWGGIVSSILGLFHANGGVVDKPSIAGEDGEEVVVPVEKHTQNSTNLLQYAASKLGQKSYGITPDFQSKHIAETAMNLSLQNTADMSKTNELVGNTNKILVSILSNMSSQQPETIVINMNTGGNNNGASQQDISNQFNRLRETRQIKI